MAGGAAVCVPSSATTLARVTRPLRASLETPAQVPAERRVREARTCCEQRAPLPCPWRTPCQLCVLRAVLGACCVFALLLACSARFARCVVRVLRGGTCGGAFSFLLMFVFRRRRARAFAFSGLSVHCEPCFERFCLSISAMSPFCVRGEALTPSALSLLAAYRVCHAECSFKRFRKSLSARCPRSGRSPCVVRLAEAAAACCASRLIRVSIGSLSECCFWCC